MTLTGCSLNYYHQAVSGHLAILKQREPIEAILATDSDKTISQAERTKLELVQEIREMAKSTLALPVDNSYSSYVNIERNYVVWNVFAAPEFSVSPQQWCYPIIGCASYRGYYREQAARKYAEKLVKKNLDTFVGGVRAYSTLGWFDDPVLNTFLSQDDLNIAALLFHETSHRIAYAKDDTAFNESFATAIELFGIEVWLKNNNDTIAGKDIKTFYEKRELKAEFIQVILDSRSTLKTIYASDLDETLMREEKKRVFKTLKEDLDLLDRRYNNQSNYGQWAVKANNASIATIDSYHRWVDAIRKKLDITLAESDCNIDNMNSETCQKQLGRFYKKIKSVAKMNNESRQLVLKEWQELPSKAVH